MSKNREGRKQSHTTSVYIAGSPVEVLHPTESTKYLGRALTFNDYHERQINHRVAAGWAKFAMRQRELCDRRIAFEKRLRLFSSVVTPTAMPTASRRVGRPTSRWEDALVSPWHLGTESAAQLF